MIIFPLGYAALPLFICGLVAGAGFIAVGILWLVASFRQKKLPAPLPVDATSAESGASHNTIELNIPTSAPNLDFTNTDADSPEGSPAPIPNGTDNAAEPVDSEPTLEPNNNDSEFSSIDDTDTDDPEDSSPVPMPNARDDASELSHSDDASLEDVTTPLALECADIAAASLSIEKDVINIIYSSATAEDASRAADAPIDILSPSSGEEGGDVLSGETDTTMLDASRSNALAFPAVEPANAATSGGTASYHTNTT